MSRLSLSSRDRVCDGNPYYEGTALAYLTLYLDPSAVFFDNPLRQCQSKANTFNTSSNVRALPEKIAQIRVGARRPEFRFPYRARAIPRHPFAHSESH